MIPSGIITFLTDFGLTDPYVGVMKGVVLDINPGATIVDISHGVQPGDILGASFLLMESYSYFPRGTIHVVVVDPGVGTSRRPLIIVTDEYFFVGPDNGVFSRLIHDRAPKAIIHLANTAFFRHPVSNTFHGRDVFAPVAAHLSLGADPQDMGVPIKDPVKLSIPAPIKDGKRLQGQVIRVDRFGNLITNISATSLKPYLDSGRDNLMITAGPIKIRQISSTYGDVPVNQELAIIGSSGFLEISVNQGRADKKVDEVGKVIGMPVVVEAVGERQDT
ncbi:MAG: hypothetical protein DRH12_06825 [Deltaproteobacteria bacterium]|nr:MAG: hypothetical protein DRH12_06825 [Deltaproteobacteria bacterium]